MYTEGLKSNAPLCFLCNLIAMITDIIKTKSCFSAERCRYYGDFKYIGRNFYRFELIVTNSDTKGHKIHKIFKINNDQLYKQPCVI